MTLILSACSTAKKTGDIDGDVYTGKETEYLASGVPDRVFFATNKSSLTSASRATLRKQATFLRKNKNLNVTIEGHADERGTREYNLALGERRANAAKDYLLTMEYLVKDFGNQLRERKASKSKIITNCLVAKQKICYCKS